MNGKEMLKQIAKVSFSNICTLISGVFVGFVIPKVLGAYEYGNYKLFTLYASYIGLFSFGISEGIYLRYSGIQYEELKKPVIRFYTKLLFGIQVIIALIIVIITVMFAKDEYRFIFIALSVYLIEVNMTTYYQYVAQMTMRFGDYTYRNIVKTILTILAVIAMTVFYFANEKQSLSYRIYVFMMLGVSTILYLTYCRKFADITVGKTISKQSGLLEIKEIIKLGVPFLLASLCSTLILNIDKQFVSLLFDPAVYGTYAFAYSLLTLVTMCTSAISTVLFPALKRVSQNSLTENYDKISSIVIVFVSFMMLSFFPLKEIVLWFLPKYAYSLDIFRIVFPGLTLTSLISVVIQNFYKLIDKNSLFLRCNIVVLGLSVIANFLAYALFKSPEAISYASIVTLFVYYNISEWYFRKHHSVKWKKNTIYILIMGTGFYLSSLVSNTFVAIFSYLVLFILVTRVVMPNTIEALSLLIKRKGE